MQIFLHHTPPPWIRLPILAALFTGVLHLPGFGQSINTQRASLPLERLSGPVTLDGLSAEAAWQAVAPLPMTVYEPVFEGEATERTEIRLAYDDAYLYVAGRFFDAAPAGVRVNSLYRDRDNGDDAFGILLDTFGDREHARWFWTTPAGVRGDRAVSGDGNAYNDDWNTYWDVATVQTGDGWFAEMRIPFSSLGFQTDRGRVVMGVIAYRFIARKNERHVYPALSPDRSFATPSRARDFLLEGIRSQRPVYLTPYALGGAGRAARLNEPGTAYRRDGTFVRDLGLDLKYNVTSNLTLDATVNTDFAQVEADDQQVNLTRFSLFFPEKRQFFQERAGIFQFGTLGFASDRLFHSRTIGLRGGAVVPILGGARMVGRVGTWDVGLLDMQTARSGGQVAENFGVLRLRRRVFNPFSYAGGMVTSRLGEDGSYNVTYGLDGTFRLYGDDYLTLKWAQTFDYDQPGDAWNARLIQAQLNRRRNVGFNYWLTATTSGPGFRPGMGFTTRSDITELGWYASYGWLRGDQARLRRVNPLQFMGYVILRNPDRSVESALVEYDSDYTWKSGANLWMDLEMHHEDLRTPLAFTDAAVVPAGRYTFFRAEGGYNTAPVRLWNAGAGWGLMTFYDGWRADFNAGPTWHASRHLSMRASYGANAVRFPERGQGFDAHVLRLRVEGALNTQVSVGAFVQYNSAADAASVNVRFRYNFREGSDLWIVYNEGLNLDRERLSPMLPLSSERTVLFKYTYTFAL